MCGEPVFVRVYYRAVKIEDLRCHGVTGWCVARGVVRPTGAPDFWYRVVHGDSELDWLTIGQVERILAEAGWDISDLNNVQEQPIRPQVVGPSDQEAAR